MMTPARFIRARDKDYFLETFSILVSSGMSIIDALDSIVAEVRSGHMRRLIFEIKKQIDNGSSLWRTLEQTHIFVPHTISLLRIGEQSGRLAQNLHLISLQQAKERYFNSKIRSAMLYPVFVLSLTLVVGFCIAWLLLPRLALVFTQLHLKLPFFTSALVAFGTFLNDYGAIVIPLFIVVITAVIYFVFYYPKTKHIGHRVLLFLPGISGLIREVEIARFTYFLGTLLEAGLPIVQAIWSATEASEFRFYQKLYRHISQSIEEGNSFQKSFASYHGVRKLIPMPIQYVIVAGEKSGSLSSALLRINEAYESKVEDTTKNLAVILEPLLLVVVWLGVMAVALAVVVPIYSLIGQFNVQ